MGLIEKGFFWKNEPELWSVQDDKLIVHSMPNTDFWQRTHYGFRCDTGHCLFKEMSGDFTMTLSVSYKYELQFDQCGIMVYKDESCWMKASVEKENEHMGRLGSVVTNFAYSDWATADVPASLDSLSYRLHRRGDDFLIERAAPGEDWAQMRIFHLHGIEDKINVGIYACSPKDSSFKAEFTLPEFSECAWVEE